MVFETWASDRRYLLENPPLARAGRADEAAGERARSGEVARGARIAGEPELPQAIDVPCKPPVGAAVGGFPIGGTPTPCIAEQVARNRAQFDYIVNNNLNTQAGLAAAYAKSFKVEMPVESIAVKGDWIPLPALLRWIPQLGDIANIRKLYYTQTVGSVEYALLSLHVSSRQNPNWVWGTFEHQMNPGRCDYIGCFDSFGAQTPRFHRAEQR